MNNSHQDDKNYQKEKGSFEWTIETVSRYKVNNKESDEYETEVLYIVVDFINTQACVFFYELQAWGSEYFIKRRKYSYKYNNQSYQSSFYKSRRIKTKVISIWTVEILDQYVYRNGYNKYVYNKKEQEEYSVIKKYFISFASKYIQHSKVF